MKSTDITRRSMLGLLGLGSLVAATGCIGRARRTRRRGRRRGRRRERRRDKTQHEASLGSDASEGPPEV